LDSACELNERCYNLAACGTPQVVDRPPLLAARFRPDSLFVGATPGEYREAFEAALSDPAGSAARGLRSLEDVCAGHTVLHRADSFVRQLEQDGLLPP
jgi:hypothetical protein